MRIVASERRRCARRCGVTAGPHWAVRGYARPTGATFLNKPYYVFRPAQVVRRLALLVGRNPSEAILPWGVSIRFDRSEAVGSAIARTGLYDLLVCETLYRLADPGELVLDIGANIGVMTSVLAHRVGPSGEVLAAEAHPTTAQRLSANVERWGASSTITVVRKAVSDRSGAAALHNPTPDLGTVTLQARGDTIAEAECVTLDELLSGRAVGVLKLDVEGHEEAVLRGAHDAIAERRIRDVVFEDLHLPPTAVMRLLEAAGYTVYKLESRLRGPALVAVERPTPHRAWEPPSYLATLDPARARSRIRSWGWHVLRGG